MKIAYVLAEFPSVSETFILREIRALEARGIDVTIFSLRRPPAGRVHADAQPLAAGTVYRPRPWRGGLRGLGAPLAAVARGKLARPALLLKTLRLLPRAAGFAREAAERGVRHVHAHFLYVPGDVAMAAAALLGTGFSVSAHAWDIHAAPAGAYRECARRAAFIAVCSRRGLDALRARYGAAVEGKLALAHHGVEPARYGAAPAESDRILAVGRLEEKKGFAVLVDACAGLRRRGIPFRCTIAGEGRERARIERRIADRGVGSQVELRGQVTQEEVAALYRDASVFVMPSVVARGGDRDGLPNVVLEAMASGLPVVATDASAADEAVEDGVSGFLVRAGEPEALSDRIALFLQRPDLRRAMGGRGRAIVAGRFDISANVAALARRFEACAAGGARRMA